MKRKGVDIINDCECNYRTYMQMPDGYRLIYEHGIYVGRYNPELDSVI